MKRTATLMLSTLGMTLWGSSAIATELVYKWKKGDVHRFSYQDDTQMDIQMGGMASVSTRLKVRSKFSEKVLKVRKNGTADIELKIEELDIYQGEQKVGSVLSKIPKSARKVRAEVDRKGHAKFHKMVTVYFHEGEVHVGIHKAQAGPGGMSVSGSASASGPEGGVEVDLVASFDPSTGKLTASAKVKEKKAKLKKTKIKEEDPSVDVLPKQIFEMMVLPEGSMAAGSATEVKTPLGKIEARLDALEGQVAKLSMKMNNKIAGGGGAMPGMPDMGGIPGMGGMPGMGGGAGAPGLTMKADLKTKFDVKKGRLMELDGNLTMDMSSGPAKVKTTSTFSLDRNLTNCRGFK